MTSRSASGNGRAGSYGNPVWDRARHIPMKRPLMLIAVLALVLAACGGGDDSGGDGTTTTTLGLDPDEVLLRIDDVGGFVPVEFNLNRMPRYLLTADGTLYSQGPQIEIFPGPLLPNIQRTMIGDDDIAALVDLVEAMGLPSIDDETNDEAANFVADASTTVISYFDAAGAHRYRVYALGMGEITDERASILLDITLTLDQLTLEGEPLDPYTGDRVQVWVTPGTPNQEGLSTIEPWPSFMPAPAEIPVVFQEFRCIVVGQAAATEALATFAAANQLTLWQEGDDLYSFLARPLLPGEEGCIPGAGL
jgi:hypothetical protein